MTYILGISSYYHDSAATLIKNGEIINAVQEERFSRIKHDSNFPFHSINFLLKNNNIKLHQIDNVVFYDKPILKFERLLETFLSSVPYGFKFFKIAMPIWIKEKIFLKNMIIKCCKKIDKKFISSRLMFGDFVAMHFRTAK